MANFVNPMTLPEYKNDTRIRLYTGDLANLKVDFLFANESIIQYAGESQVKKYLAKNVYSDLIKNDIQIDDFKTKYGGDLQKIMILYLQNISSGFRAAAKYMCVKDVFSENFMKDHYMNFLKIVCNRDKDNIRSIGLLARDFIEYSTLINDIPTLETIVICSSEKKLVGYAQTIDLPRNPIEFLKLSGHFPEKEYEFIDVGTYAASNPKRKLFCCVFAFYNQNRDRIDWNAASAFFYKNSDNRHFNTHNFSNVEVNVDINEYKEEINSLFIIFRLNQKDARLSDPLKPTDNILSELKFMFADVTLAGYTASTLNTATFAKIGEYVNKFKQD
jgi:hypothetical protein